MRLNKAQIRDWAIVAIMLSGFFFVMSRPVVKVSPGEKIQLAEMAPAEFLSWSGQTFDTSEYKDQWQSINELLVRQYGKENPFSFREPFTSLGFILEYSSDLRQNFSFHFPENCHRASGNHIQFLEPLKIDLGDGKSLHAKRLFIKGLPNSSERYDKIVTYWLVIGQKQYYRTFYIKLDQMLSGLLSRAKSGFLVRVDYSQNFEYSPAGIEKASRITSAFIRDLYDSVEPEKRKMLFGEELE